LTGQFGPIPKIGVEYRIFIQRIPLPKICFQNLHKDIDWIVFLEFTHFLSEGMRRTRMDKG